MSYPAAPGFLPAVLGYQASERGIRVRVCAWCPGKLRAEKWAEPLEVNHSICPECTEKMQAKLIGEMPKHFTEWNDVGRVFDFVDAHDPKKIDA